MELLLESITKTQVGSMLVSVFTDAAVSTHADTEIQRGVCVCLCVCVYMCVCVYKYVFARVCVYGMYFVYLLTVCKTFRQQDIFKKIINVIFLSFYFIIFCHFII